MDYDKAEKRLLEMQKMDGSTKASEAELIALLTEGAFDLLRNINRIAFTLEDKVNLINRI